MILNGGTVAGGSIAIGGTGGGAMAYLYAGSDNPSTISSTLNGTSGLVKFGQGTLVLSGNNAALTGNIYVDSGTLNIQNGGALGVTGITNVTTVAAGASLAVQGNTAVGGNSLTLNGAGVGGAGALVNVQDCNSFAGPITLNSNSQINTVSGTLTLGGLLQGAYDVTKTGSGVLAITGTNTLFGVLKVAEGTLLATNSLALGSTMGGLGPVVSDGATLAIQGGMSSAVPVVLMGSGTNGNGGWRVLADRTP